MTSLQEFIARWHVLIGLRWLVAGIVATVVAALTRRWLRSTIVPALVALLAVAVEVRFDPGRPGTLVGLALCAVTLLGGLRGSDAPTRLRATTAPLVAAAMVGVWATVPDTEAPLAAAAALAPTLVWTATRPADLDRGDLGLCLAVLVVVADVGSAGRQTAIAGAICCGWIVVWGWVRRSGTSSAPGPNLLVVQAVSIVVGSRVVAHISAIAAWTISALVVVAGCAAVEALWERAEPRE